MASNRLPNREKIAKGWDAFADVVPGDVAAAMGALGLEILSEEYGEVSARCPAHLERLGHEDRNPSFSVNADHGKFNCFSCGFSGRFAELVAYVLGVEHGQAVAWIRSKGTVAAVTRMYEEREPEPERKKISEASLALYVDPPADELDKRGIFLEAARKFGILWDPKHSAWITPIRDVSGRLMGWQTKSSGYVRNRPYGVKKSETVFGLHLTPPVPGTGVLIESPLDCAVLATFGVEYPVATFGAKVSAAQIALLSRFRRVIVWMDNDEAGWRSAEYVGWELHKRYTSVAVVTHEDLPWGCDPGGYKDADGNTVLLTSKQIHAQLERAMPFSLMRW
ncbi:CHC2 zinc finger domain-containing protein [Nonomuraea sp. SYSU D8015]|uniref:CHC2 zinc finger domain-containing protein n=1 Tax=Nonomuraea sp. SYSU D8015 TaxID=2593644 RepID=UPI0016615396|nr:CHC2 zinc finger domain-containing protein [Nonomuraea sp. SYSU D8015]